MEGTAIRPFQMESFRENFVGPRLFYRSVVRCLGKSDDAGICEVEAKINPQELFAKYFGLPLRDRL